MPCYHTATQLIRTAELAAAATRSDLVLITAYPDSSRCTSAYSLEGGPIRMSFERPCEIARRIQRDRACPLYVQRFLPLIARNRVIGQVRLYAWQATALLEDFDSQAFAEAAAPMLAEAMIADRSPDAGGSASGDEGATD